MWRKYFKTTISDKSKCQSPILCPLILSFIWQGCLFICPGYLISSLFWVKLTWNGFRYSLEQNLQNCYNSWRCRISSSQVLDQFHTNPIRLMLLQLAKFDMSIFLHDSEALGSQFPKRNSDRKKTAPNIEVFLESLEALLE